MPMPPDKLTETERELLDYLQKHCWGRAAARTQAVIAEALGWQPRQVHEVACALRHHSYAVGSSCGRRTPDGRRRPMGMYMCCSFPERREVIEQLERRFRSLYRTMRALGFAPIPGMEKQLMLFGDQEAVAIDGTSKPMAELIGEAADA